MTWVQKCFGVIFPTLCPLCKTVVQHDHTLCATCWPQVEFITDPCCVQCSLPLPAATLEEKQKCLGCLQKEFSFIESRSAFLYTRTSKKMILDLKHGHQLHMGPLLAAWMTKAGQPLIEKSDLLIPVPLHWTRLLKRGFNQATVLTKHIAKNTNKPFLINTLRRTKKTPSQDGLNALQRVQNMTHVFSVHTPQKIKNKSILLIDDVMTTGSTLDACAKVLLLAGAKCVRTLTTGRVRPSHKNGELS